MQSALSARRRGEDRGKAELAAAEGEVFVGRRVAAIFDDESRRR